MSFPKLELVRAAKTSSLSSNFCGIKVRVRCDVSEMQKVGKRNRGKTMRPPAMKNDFTFITILDITIKDLLMS